MLEKQNIGEWLPERYQKWKPLLVSLLITPFALLVGISGFGPEGHWVSIGAVIFPWGEGAFLTGALLNSVPIFYVSLTLALLQYPLYGFVLSLVGRSKITFIVILVLHGLAVVVFFTFLFMLRRTAS